MKKIAFLAALAALGDWGYTKISPLASLGAGYGAKITCSAVFVSHRDPESVRNAELAMDNIVAKLQSTTIDREHQTVTGHFTPLFSRTAVYRPGLGCTLLADITEGQLRQQGELPATPMPPADANALWPEGERLTEASPALQKNIKAAMDWAFAEEDPQKPRRTRAVVVAQNGRLVAERYADGFHASMPLQGWSMGKSITNALVGILVRQGKLDIHKPAPVAEWRKPSDPRGVVTLDHMLRMSSGLAFDETYAASISDATQMLFLEPAAGTYAAARPLAIAPESTWYYSSGTTNIISRVIRETVGGSLPDYWQFPHKELFAKVGIRSAVLEPDSSGVIIGSSFDYMTARDWARLGQLYLNDGVWNGERILPEGWVKYSTTPTPKSPNGKYGAHIWLNAGDGGDPAKREFQKVPADAFYFSGFEGQQVVVIPSFKLVAVRLGVSQAIGAWSFEHFLELLTAP